MQIKSDKDYCNKINALIPQAEKTAYAAHPDIPYMDGQPKKEWNEKRKKWADEWNFCFHSEMNRLAHEAGIRISPKLALIKTAA